jgi:uncharacterized protein DUF4389
MSVKDNAKNVDTWLRGLFIVIFGVIFYVLYFVIWVLVVFQFLTKVVTGNLNDNLGQLSESLTSYAFQILLYITFQSEERPFPFSPWPSSDKTALPEPEEEKNEDSDSE